MISHTKVLYHLRDSHASGTYFRRLLFLYAKTNVRRRTGNRKEDDTMPTAKKLPSGSWRCQIFSHYEIIKNPDGTTKQKRIYKSFTCDDKTAKGKKKCEKMAADWSIDRKSFSDQNLLFGGAIDRYISGRESVLSPRTITDYKSIRRNYAQSLMEKPIGSITQEDIQKAINFEAKTHSPKTIRNIHGLISAVMRLYRPDFALNTSLPKKRTSNLYIPSEEEIQRLVKHVADTEMELPVLLAAFGPMRRGEICALKAEDISGNIVHVCRNMVRTEDGKWIEKTPKSYAGDRYIEFPDFVAEKWEGITNHIVKMNPNQITDRFGRVLKNAGLPHFRFHDLRHYSASIQHALGVPDAYIMQRGGWGNDGVLKTIYRHALKDKSQEMSRIANEHFSELCNTKCNTE